MKNILKKILNNKKVKKVVKKKVKTVKKVVKQKKVSVVMKVKKVTKELNKKKKIKEPKKKNKIEVKTDPLRIPKNNEQKPEIKKVKKQETEKRLFKAKDYVVYPKHGVGQITETKKINISPYITKRIGKPSGEGFGFNVGVKGAVEMLVDPIGWATAVIPVGIVFKPAAYASKRLGQATAKVTGLEKYSKKGRETFAERAKGFDKEIATEMFGMKEKDRKLW